jgi:lipid II:glycine glycyltransferase (peptidoglycan interpeptide bridge formation enzyme)
MIWTNKVTQTCHEFVSFHTGWTKEQWKSSYIQSTGNYETQDLVHVTL